MNRITINILPENFKPLPVIFNTASAFYQQKTTEYSGNKQDFYQILIVLEGKGTVYSMFIQEQVHVRSMDLFVSVRNFAGFIWEMCRREITGVIGFFKQKQNA